MGWKVVWKSAITMPGALFVMIPGTFLMGMLCVGNLDTVKVGQSE